MRHKLFGERAAMGKSQCCCFSVVSLAAAVGSLQLVLIAIYISNSALIYDNWNNWWTNPINNVSTVGNSYLQVLVVNTMGFTVAWAICLLLFALSFYFMSPQLVVPNMVAQFLAIIWGVLFIGGISQALSELPNGVIQYQTPMEKQKNTFIIAALVFAVISWFFQLVFFGVLIRFFSFLKEQQGIPIPISPMQHHDFHSRESIATTAHIRPQVNQNQHHNDLVQHRNEPTSLVMENPNMQDFQ